MNTASDARVIIKNTGSGQGAAEPGCHATILILDPAQLYAVQWATRDICRTLGFDEGGLYDAVIAVTELVHKELIAPSRRGKLHLSVIRERGRPALEASVELEQGAARA